MRKRFLGALGASLLALGLAASPASAQRNGLYDVRGTNPDGSAYEGTFGLGQIGLSSWRAAWQVAGNRIDGYAMSSGNTLAVGFTLGDRPGLAIYTINPDGTMTGQWTIIGSSALGTETLTPRP